MVEHHLAMVGVAGSNPVFRLSLSCRGGGTGTRTGLKIPRLVTTVPVRFRSSAYNDAPLAQLDRVSDYESEGCRFDSCWVHIYREIAQLGRALRSGRRGRRFESCYPDKTISSFEIVFFI